MCSTHTYIYIHIHTYIHTYILHSLHTRSRCLQTCVRFLVSFLMYLRYSRMTYPGTSRKIILSCRQAVVIYFLCCHLLFFDCFFIFSGWHGIFCIVQQTPLSKTTQNTRTRRFVTKQQTANQRSFPIKTI